MEAGLNFLKKLEESVMIKIGVILFLVLILLIPLSLISGVIDEREQRKFEVEREVGNSRGGRQHIQGPFLTIPVLKTKYYAGKDSVFSQRWYYEHIPADEIKVNGKALHEILSRGIFDVVTYDFKFDISGDFSLPEVKKKKDVKLQYSWDDAFISMGISDPSTLGEELNIQIDGKPRTASTQLRKHSPVDFGIQIPFIVDTTKNKVKMKFSGSLLGVKSLMFNPQAKISRVTMESDWASPSFGGVTLPRDREVHESGFTAKWIKRSMVAPWKESENEKNRSRDGFGEQWSYFGVDFIVPVDNYRKSERTTKYGVLFIMLTFLTFFMMEVFYKIKIHPIQYLTVGIALCVFYILVVSISEHSTFNLAYLIASLATIGLVTFYSSAVLKTKSRSVIIALVMVILYSYLFTLLLSEDYSLLLGAIGLFMMMSAFMIITRNLNWYQLGKSELAEPDLIQEGN